jgi:hypothetical protein
VDAKLRITHEEVFGLIVGLWKSDKVCYKFDGIYY